jgi:hypothetical protein
VEGAGSSVTFEFGPTADVVGGGISARGRRRLQNSTRATQDACALRWKIEQFHREIKQLTGIEKCQCRKARIQRNHIACAVLVWISLTQLARNAVGLPSPGLRSPSISMAFA